MENQINVDYVRRNQGFTESDIEIEKAIQLVLTLGRDYAPPNQLVAGLKNQWEQSFDSRERALLSSLILWLEEG